MMEDMRRLNSLLSEIDAAYHEASQRLGLSDSAMQIIYVICGYGEECLLSEICRLSGTSKQTINSALRKLEKGDYVRLEPLAGRRKKVCLTQRGKALAESTARRLIAMENEVFGAWTEQERAQYLALTQRYLNEIKAKIKELAD
ncbi:MAG: MarR family winged helix-turn-helix transcriptional regulator [Candidatus Ventricola sp.]